MQTPLSFAALQQDMPALAERLMQRAQQAKSRRFDPSTDPATWNWSVEWFESDDAIDESLQKTWHDLRATDPEAYLKARLAAQSLQASVKLKTGVTALSEPLSEHTSLPSTWVETFAFKTFEPIAWEGSTTTLYQPRDPARPGWADVAVLAAYARPNGQLGLLIHEGYQDRDLTTWSLMEIDERQNVASIIGTLERVGGDWDVPLGASFRAGNEEWHRLDLAVAASRFSGKVWHRGVDRSLTAMTPDASVLPPVPQEETKHWAVGDARPEQEWPLPVLIEVQADEAEASPTLSEAVLQKKSLKEMIQAKDTQGVVEALDRLDIENSGLDWAYRLNALMLFAASCSTMEIVDIIVARGADLDVVHPRYKTVQHAAVVNNNVDVMEGLHARDRLNGNDGDDNGYTWLMHALVNDGVEAADRLVEWGSNVNEGNLFGNTALHLAAQEGCGKSVKWLIEHQADPSIENIEGAIAEELVPFELPAMIDVLAEYRFACERGESFEVPEGFMKALEQGLGQANGALGMVMLGDDGQPLADFRDLLDTPEDVQNVQNNLDEVQQIINMARRGPIDPNLPPPRRPAGP